MKKLRFMLLFLLMFVFAVLPATAENVLPPLQLHQINLGCAEGYLLVSGEKAVLIDCGTDTDVTQDNHVLFDYLASSGIDHVDAYFVTHYHNDHALNISQLMALYGREDTVIYGPSEELPDRFDPGKAVYRPLHRGEEVSVGAFDVQCIGPLEVTANGEENVDSLNFIITYGQRKMLFTGDYMHGDVRREYPEAITNIDVLSFPHHGLKPWYITAATIQMAGAKIVLVPGRGTGQIRGWMMEYLEDLPLILSASSGHIVLIISDEEIIINENVEPGAFAGTITQ